MYSYSVGAQTSPQSAGPTGGAPQRGIGFRTSRALPSTSFPCERDAHAIQMRSRPAFDFGLTFLLEASWRERWRRCRNEWTRRAHRGSANPGLFARQLTAATPAHAKGREVATDR